MQIGYNVGTTLERSALEQDLKFCEESGFDLIELEWDKSLAEYLENHTLSELRAYFDNHRLKPLSLNALASINNRAEAEEDEVVRKFEKMAEAAETLGIPYIVVTPLRTEAKLTRADIQASCVRVLRRLSEIAEPKGIKIALEFVGEPEYTVNTLEQSLAIVEETARDNVGATFDFFHFHAMNSKLETLREADPERIFIVHLSDAPDYVPGMLREHEDRLWPGQGVMRSEEMLNVLREIGCQAAFSVEVFQKEYDKLSVEEAIRTAYETASKLLERTPSNPIIF